MNIYTHIFACTYVLVVLNTYLGAKLLYHIWNFKYFRKEKLCVSLVNQFLQVWGCCHLLSHFRQKRKFCGKMELRDSLFLCKKNPPETHACFFFILTFLWMIKRCLLWMDLFSKSSDLLIACSLVFEFSYTLFTEKICKLTRSSAQLLMKFFRWPTP